MNEAPTPLSPPLPPPPPPPPVVTPFDTEGYRAVLNEVYEVATRVRSNWERTMVGFLRADAIFIIAFGLSTLVQSSEPWSPANPYLGPSWFAFVGFVVFGIAILAVPRALLRRSQRWHTRRGKLPPLDVGSSGPTLDTATRVFGQMKKEWGTVYAMLAVSILLLLIGLLSVGDGLARTAAVTLGTGGSLPAELWPLGLGVGLVASGLAVWVWASASFNRLRRLAPSVETVDARFRQLEWTFWQRY